MAGDSLDRPAETVPEAVELPSSTAWPMILAFGLTLVFAGLVTSASVSVLGAVLAVSGGVGWFLEVLPHEKRESVPVAAEAVAVATTRPAVAKVTWISKDLHRARLPLEIYPISAGVKGGLAGGAAMAVLAMIYGISSGRGMWYPVNLLVSGFFPARRTTEQIAHFHWDSLLLATAAHLATSLLVGLLYGATLPIFPRRPILLGGVIGPVLWSGVVHAAIELFDPELVGRINWFWFLISQIGFGIVAGIVVSRQEKVATWQHLPLAVRAGMEGAAHMDDSADPGEEEGPPK
jgi:hypothetical protein